MKKSLLVFAVLIGIVVGTTFRCDIPARAYSKSYLKEVDSVGVTPVKDITVFEDTKHKKVIYILTEVGESNVAISVADMPK